MHNGKPLIKKELFQKLINEYFRLKTEGKDTDKYISKMVLQNPKLAAAFKGMDDAMLHKALAYLEFFKKHNLDTKDIEKYLKKHYTKV